MNDNQPTLDSVLGSDAVISYSEGKRRFAVDLEEKPVNPLTGKADGVLERSEFPERYPDFEISFAGLTIRQVLEDVIFSTAYIDIARKAFRSKDPEQAEAWRSQFESSESGRPLVKLGAEEFAGLKLPKSQAELEADAAKAVAGMSNDAALAMIAKLQAMLGSES